MTLKSLGDLLEMMDRKEFTQARLARSAGVSRQFIWQVVKGEKKSMKPITAERIAEALDVPLGILFLPSVATAATQNVKGQAA